MKKRIQSFKCAFRGIGILVAGQPNARLHLAAAVAVIALGLLTGVSNGEWLAIILAISTVWTAEALNTALEHLSDRTAPGRHPLVAAAKDTAAAGVLLASLGALAVGLMIFIPKLI